MQTTNIIETPIDGNALTKEEKKAIVKDMTIDHIIAWCKKNGQLKWLEKKMSETVTREYYGYVKEKDPETGKMRCVKDEYGKKIIDRSKPPRRKTQPIGFMEIKRDFIEKFMPELKVGEPKAAAPSMMDKLKAAKEG